MSDDPEAEEMPGLQADVVVGGRYRVVRLLGRGGVGEVYEVKTTDLERRLALKILLPAHSTRHAVTRLETEAKLLTRAKNDGNPFLPDITEFGFDKDLSIHFMVIEFLDGCSLADAVAQQPDKKLPLAHAIHIAIQVLAALELMHKLGFIHRDVKPDNIFLVRLPNGGYQVKLLDLGIAVDQKAEIRATSTRMILGSAYYMAPEQCEGARRVTERSDLWSVGAVLFVVLSRYAPFDGDSQIMIMASIMTKDPEDLPNDVPQPVADIIKKALQKDPSQRYESAAAFKQALLALGLGEPTDSILPTPGASATLAPATPPNSATKMSVETASRERRGGWSRPQIAIGAVLVTLFAFGIGGTFAILTNKKPTTRAEVDSSFRLPPPITPVVQNVDAEVETRDAGSSLRLAASRDAGASALPPLTAVDGGGTDAQPERPRSGRRPHRPHVRHIGTSPPRVRCRDVVVNGLHQQQCDDD